MKRIQYHGYGGPEVMRLEEYSPRPLRSGDVRVRVKAAGLNPVDWKIRAGAMKAMTGRSFPRAMGSDFAGIVEEVGPGVTRLKAGDEVFGTAPFKEAGAFAPVVTTQEKLVVHKPAAVSFEQAACLPVPGAAAWTGLVDKAKLRAGQRVFVNGCTGAVGQAAVQIAKALGASVAGTCSRAAMPYAKQLGVDPVLDYAVDDLSSCNGKFDVLLDTAGTLTLEKGFALLANGGVMLDPNTTGAKFLRGLFSSRYKMLMASPSVATLQQIAKLAAEGKLCFQIGATVSLEEAIPHITNAERGNKLPGRSVFTTTG